MNYPSKCDSVSRDMIGGITKYTTKHVRLLLLFAQLALDYARQIKSNRASL